jgi:hypothetical protein
MAACAWSLRKWMVAVAIFLFWKKSGLIFCKIPKVFFVLTLKNNFVKDFSIFTLHQKRSMESTW